MNKFVVENVKHTYLDGNKKTEVLKGISAEFKSGKFYSILGESGSGKTTLLSLLAGLDSIQKGDILFNEESIKKIGLANFRRKYVNIIFQAYNLITYMTARENIEVAIDISSLKVPNKKEYAYALLEKVGITKDKADRLVLKLSGGEQQRVAIARSMVGDEPIILADEPTGNLDEETEIKIIDLFEKLAKDGKIVIVVTHSKNVSAKADIVYKIRKGIIELEK
jgi:putative ABC transport system ATP-binding protein